MKDFLKGVVILLFVAPIFLVFSEDFGYMVAGISYVITLIVFFSTTIGTRTAKRIKELLDEK